MVEGDQTRVPVIDKATGKILTGEDAPLSSELKQWLERNPGLVLIVQNNDHCVILNIDKIL